MTGNLADFFFFCLTRIVQIVLTHLMVLRRVQISIFSSIENASFYNLLHTILPVQINCEINLLQNFTITNLNPHKSVISRKLQRNFKRGGPKLV